MVPASSNNIGDQGSSARRTMPYFFGGEADSRGRSFLILTINANKNGPGVSPSTVGIEGGGIMVVMMRDEKGRSFEMTSSLNRKVYQKRLSAIETGRAFHPHL